MRGAGVVVPSDPNRTSVSEDFDVNYRREAGRAAFLPAALLDDFIAGFGDAATGFFFGGALLGLDGLFAAAFFAGLLLCASVAFLRAGSLLVTAFGPAL